MSIVIVFQNTDTINIAESNIKDFRIMKQCLPENNNTEIHSFAWRMIIRKEGNELHSPYGFPPARRVFNYIAHTNISYIIVKEGNCAFEIRDTEFSNEEQRVIHQVSYTNEGDLEVTMPLSIREVSN